MISEIEKKNDITLEMLQKKYLARFGKLISISTVHYHLNKLNISLKKSFYDPKKLADIPEKDRKLLYETDTCLNMTPQLSRSKKIKELIVNVQLHKENIIQR